MIRLHILHHGRTLCGVLWPMRPPQMLLDRWISFAEIDEAIERVAKGSHAWCDACRAEGLRRYRKNEGTK